jgi:hypothetical protein
MPISAVRGGSLEAWTAQSFTRTPGARVPGRQYWTRGDLSSLASRNSARSTATCRDIHPRRSAPHPAALAAGSPRAAVGGRPMVRGRLGDARASRSRGRRPRRLVCAPTVPWKSPAIRAARRRTSRAVTGDLRRQPTTTHPPRTMLHRIHRSRSDPWYLDASADGRFSRSRRRYRSRPGGQSVTRCCPASVRDGRRPAPRLRAIVNRPSDHGPERHHAGSPTSPGPLRRRPPLLVMVSPALGPGPSVSHRALRQPAAGWFAALRPAGRGAS